MVQYICIDEATFEQLVEGATVVGRSEDGISYHTRDGRLVAQMHDGTDWYYAIVRES